MTPADRTWTHTKHAIGLCLFVLFCLTLAFWLASDPDTSCGLGQTCGGTYGWLKTETNA